MELNLQNPTHALVSHCHMMLHQMLGAGHKPLMYIMSPGTRRAIIESAVKDKAVELAKDRPWWKKAFWRKEPSVESLVAVPACLLGVPICPNEFMPDGMVQLQALPVITQQGVHMNGKGYVPDEQIRKEQAADMAQESPFWRREPVAVPVQAQAGQVPTLDDLAQGDGPRPSPSDILIKAMADIDGVKHIAVLEIMHNGGVEACTNMDHTTLTGAIQKFALWVAMNGRD